MDDLRTLALDAALRLDQAARGRLPDATSVSVLGFRYGNPESRALPRHAAAHLLALSALGLHPPGAEAVDRALAAIGRDLARAAAEPGDTALQVRCLEFCLALHEGLRADPATPLGRAA